MNNSQTIHYEIRNTLALVLAGGRGSRLQNLTETRSKPAVPFGGKFRIVDFPLSNCINSGLRKIAVLTQYRAHSLIHHLQRGWSFLRPELGEFVEIWPAQQQTKDVHWYQGTADAVHQNLEIITQHKPRFVLILAGDHIYKQDYSKMLAEHIESGADVSVACMSVPRSEASSFGVVNANAEGRIVEFVEKPVDPPAMVDDPERSFVSMGIYIFNYHALMEVLEEDALDSSSSHDFGNDVIPKLVESSKVMAHNFSRSAVHDSDCYWKDVGTVDAYWEANIDLTAVTPQLDLYDRGWPIWTHQSQYPSAKFIFNKGNRTGAALDSLVSAGCVVSGGMVDSSLLFTDARINSYSIVYSSLILPHACVGRHCSIKRAIVDVGCQLPERLVVGDDAELDAERFYRSEQGITLITQEMVDRL
ncbi:MAG: glucose-1-phosphate adenylyltransferase [Thiotrichales bacterium]|jgi:glucose-1-phosphate adenylyltransferase|nr:glucose-1-phosphate adenylyltransferase [Thiotrichales bacterium]